MIDFRQEAFKRKHNVKTVVVINGHPIPLEDYNQLLVDPKKIEFFKGLIMSVETQQAYWERIKPSKAPMLKHPLSQLETPSITKHNIDGTQERVSSSYDEPEHISSCIKRFMDRSEKQYFKKVRDMKFDWEGERN